MKRLPKQDLSQIQISDFGGLDLQPDVLSRPVNSWQIAQNVDLFTPGSVRKIVGPLQQFGPFASTIVEMFSYQRAPGSTFFMMGVGVNGHLYDITANADLATLGATGFPPCVVQFTGLSSGTQIKYLIAIISGGRPVKWDATGGVAAIGASAPAGTITLTATNSATNANAYLMQAGIQYEWTYFNPVTLHETSPSPVLSAAIMTPTVNTPPAATPFTTQISLSIPTAGPSVGSGYTQIRVYRTRDGGATFYLLPALYNSGGANQLDSNFAFTYSANPTTLIDGNAAHSIAPAPDQLMVNPPQGAPAIGANGLPPAASWAAVYQNRLWLVDGSNERLYFSNLGDFQSFGVDSYMDFSQDSYDQIVTIAPLSDRMLIFGKYTARQITGTDFSDFVEVPVDMRRGILGPRAATNDGDVIYGLTKEGLARMSFAASGPPFVGERIKPITDTIPAASYNYLVCDIDTTRGQLLFAIKINGDDYNDQIIVANLGRESPFTLLTNLPSEVACIRELENTAHVREVYMSGVDGNVYLLYGAAGSTHGTLAATLQTQPLPMEDFDIWRVYKWLELFGSDLANWQFSWSIGYPNASTGEMQFTTFSTPVPVGQPLGNRRVPIGGNGRQIILKFTHSVNNGNYAVLSKLNLPYEDKVSG